MVGNRCYGVVPSSTACNCGSLFGAHPIDILDSNENEIIKTMYKCTTNYKNLTMVRFNYSCLNKYTLF